AARLVAARRSDPGAGSFGEHDDPASFSELAGALPHDLLERVGSLAAIDVNHVEQRDTPTEERNVQQLALEHVAEFARHPARIEERLPGRLVFRQEYRRSVGKILAAEHAPADAAESLRAPDHHARPAD